MKIAVGAVGAAAVLGAGAYLITAQVLDRDANTESRNDGALAPIVAPASAEPSASSGIQASADSVGAPTSAPAPARSSATPAAAPTPSSTLSVAEQIRKAREAAAKGGNPLQPALTAAAAPGPIDERSEPVKDGSMRVITAKFDLTGHRALLWAADKGKPVGDARCTQNVRFSNKMTPAIQPNLLLCWRTSGTRSVATVLVNYKGHPSSQKSLEVIDREWAKLG